MYDHAWRVGFVLQGTLMEQAASKAYVINCMCVNEGACAVRTYQSEDNGVRCAPPFLGELGRRTASLVSMHVEAVYP